MYQTVKNPFVNDYLDSIANAVKVQDGMHQENTTQVAPVDTDWAIRRVLTAVVSCDRSRETTWRVFCKHHIFARQAVIAQAKARLAQKPDDANAQKALRALTTKYAERSVYLTVMTNMTRRAQFIYADKDGFRFVTAEDVMNTIHDLKNALV